MVVLFKQVICGVACFVKRLNSSGFLPLIQRESPAMTARKTADSGATAPQTKSAPGEVGYGRPPRHTQFRKGQSGNPGGRPRRSEIERMKALVLHEAYRTVVIRDDEGRALPASIIQAVLRSQTKLAIDGNGPAQRAFLSTVERLEGEKALSAFAAAIRRGEPGLDEEEPDAEDPDEEDEEEDEDEEDEDEDEDEEDEEDEDSEAPDLTETDAETPPAAGAPQLVHSVAAVDPPDEPPSSADEPPVRPWKRKPGPPPVRPDRYARRSIFKVGGRRIRQARICRRNSVFRADSAPFRTGRSVWRHSPILRNKMAAFGKANGAETPENRKRLVSELFTKGIETGRPPKPRHPAKYANSLINSLFSGNPRPKRHPRTFRAGTACPLPRLRGRGRTRGQSRA